MKEEANRWLKLSIDDLSSAKVNFKTKQYYVCVFLCQQAVEKGLKALLIKKTGKLIKMHDLFVLGKKVSLPDNLLNKCDRLNGVYLDTRYGDTESKPPSEKFDKGVSLVFLNIAEEVSQWIRKNI